MLGLTYLGVVHTAISLIAVGAGLASFFRYAQIVPSTGLGKVYIWTTVLTCLTALGIFEHGGFGKPHALAIATLLALGGAWVAGNTRVLGRLSPYAETVAYSATFLFHLIPGVTETTTRLPPGAPWVSSPEAPALKLATGVLGLLFVLGVGLQLRRLHRQRGMGRLRGTKPLR